MAARRYVYALALGSLMTVASGAQVCADRDPNWSEAHVKGPMSAPETRQFMRELAEFVVSNHLKRTEGSAQRGMIYEYFRVSRKGQHDQFIQGEALDTMHDGTWFAVAMVNAYRATGDAFYKEVLVRWQLPFYLAMLNQSDQLFSSEPNDGRPNDDRGWRTSKEWLLQGREKGFVPYWWDDGGSVSLEMLGRKDGDEHVNFAGHNDLKGAPNPQKRLSGYSHGSSNHMAQDLAVMIQQAWLLFRGSTDPVEQALAEQLAEAAKNLQACRARHGSPGIPMVRAALALSAGDEPARAALPAQSWASLRTARSDYRRAIVQFPADQPVSVPAFADDQQYGYYIALARTGTLHHPDAFRLAYDAYTLPQLYRAYSDDAPVPPGINVFDLHPYHFVNGKPKDVRSQRKGPSGGPRPIGSRFGPQNIAVCGWALQALRAYPGLWAEGKREIQVPNYFPDVDEAQVKAFLERELGCGLRTWEAIYRFKGYIPTGLGAGGCGAGFAWDELSDTGGYAHLISAASQWILYLDGKNDWTQHGVSPRAAK
ncbi:MAG: hypothetical protein WCJ02_04705 [bacterium]